MIDIILKHAIYDKCLAHLFDSIYKNFQIGRFNVHSYNVGDSVTMKMLREGLYPIELNKCRVVYKSNNYCIVESQDFVPAVYIHILDTVVTEMTTRIPISKDDVTH